MLDELIKHAAERGEGFGSLWHVINHAAALADLIEIKDKRRRGNDNRRYLM